MTETETFNTAPAIAQEMGIPQPNVATVIRLLSEGNTVPFISRYRKEMTGSLDDIQIHNINERHLYLVELEKRRQAILKSIDEQGKLTDELKARIVACDTKAALEDLYLPYKPKRRTRATIAKERGLEPLALRVSEQPSDGDPLTEAREFVDEEKGVPDAEAALAGARDIVAELIAENADIRTFVREHFAQSGLLLSSEDTHASEKGPKLAAKFKDYFDYQESVATIPSHRFLAIRRGEREGVLRVTVQVDDEALVNRILTSAGHVDRSPFGPQLSQAASDSFQRLISPSVENDVRIDLKMRSDRSAVDIFADNLRNLLLAAPLGGQRVVGVDPGLRTGCKCVALDETGRFLDTMTFNLVRGDRGKEQAVQQFSKFVEKHQPTTIAIGNGTGSRETERFIRQTLKDASIKDIITIQVSEAGASVYSASKIAQQEFPDLDVTVRGAVSIGRRLQDPLAELVKIEPKSIGVGQYQHDVHQPLLTRKLDEVVESCVNHVGVELNTASAPLLSQVAGIGPSLASNIVVFREENGAFANRKQLLKVPKLGPRTFEQAAGFLRIRGAQNPLDASAVHPERYDLVQQMAADMEVDLSELMGDTSKIDQIEISRYVGEGVGEPTLRDIVDEMKKPGRDPRKSFEPPKFLENVETVQDLKTGMEIEGVVTNVTAFGAFVDIGVHRDGLVHISELSDNFVKDPNDIVKVGDKMKVKVMDVDLDRERISLTAKTKAAPTKRDATAKDGGDYSATKRPRTGGRPGGGRQRQPRQQNKFSYNPFADLLKK